MVTVAAEQLSVHFEERRALDRIDLSLSSGSLIGILGPNGAGKSTLLRALLGLVPLSSGDVIIDGQSLINISKAALAQRLAYLPQGQLIGWPLSVERLVALGRLPHLAPLSRLAPGDRQAITRAMRRANIEHLAARIANTLSGGERSRALVARALAVEAPALLVDEPLASLDPRHQLEVMALLKSEAANGALVIAVLHDLTLAARYCDRLILLHHGRLVAGGAPREVMTAERLSDVYGVSAWIGEAYGGPVILPVAGASQPKRSGA